MQKSSVLRLLAAGAAGALATGALASPALAATAVTAATGGTAISATTAGPTGTFTNLGQLTVDEDNAAEISLGRFQINAPAGFEFRTTSAVTVGITGSSSANFRPALSAVGSCTNQQRTSLSVTPTASAITFHVCERSDIEAALRLTGIGVRPAAGTPLASGNMYLDGSTGAATVTGVTRGLGGTNFGSLATVAGPVASLAVTTPAAATAGVATTATVSARDAYGNTVSGYRGAVTFGSSDSTATKPGDYTFVAGDNGTRAFPVTFRKSGSQSLTVTDKATSSIAGVGTTPVVAAAATQLALTGISPATPAGAQVTPVVTARDAFGNTATGYRGSVAFSSSDAAATLPGNHTFTAADAGTRSFPGTVLRTAGNQSVTVTDGTLGATQSPITVSPGGLATLSLSPGTATVDAGASRAYTAHGRDTAGNNLGDLTADSTFSIAPDGSCTGNVCTAGTAGPHTVTATRSGATGTATLQVNPAAPVLSIGLADAIVTADGSTTTTVTVSVADVFGNKRTGDPVTLSTDGGATLSAVQNHGDGTYTATVRASTLAGTQTITATDGSATTSIVLTQLAGPAAAVTLVLSPATLTADGAATSTATITVTDLHGNARVGDTVTLTGDGDATASAVTDQGYGVYTATVTASTTAGTETFTATGGTASTTATLTELAPATVTGVSPASRGQGANGGAWGQSITVTGTGFTPGATADLGAGVTVKFTTVVDATRLVAHVAVGADAAPGARTVTVTLADGRTVTCADCFTVSAGPRVTGVNPDTMGPGGQRTVTVAGTGFTADTRVTVPASGVAVTSVQVTAGGLVIGLSTSGVAAPGPRDLIITNPGDAGQTVCAGCLVITPAPVVAEVAPAVLGGGAQTTVTVYGDNFAEGARLSFAGSGVAVVSQQRVDANTLTAVVSVAGAAVPGARTVSVVNPDAGRGASSGAFSVTGAPTVTGIAPGVFAKGSTTSVTITGTGFAAGAAVSLSTGVSVSDVVVVDGTTITATVTVAANAGAGNRTVLVTNADFGKAACAGCAKVS